MNDNIKSRVQEILKKDKSFYIYDVNGIRNNCKKFMNISYNNKVVAFATMANSTELFLEVIKSEGLSAFVNSVPHLERCIKVGFDPEKIVFTSSAMDEETMEFISEKNCIVNLDSVNQLDLWNKICPGKKVGVRCNIGTLIDPKETRAGYFFGKKSRLGLSVEDIKNIKKDNINGLHLYPGTDIVDITYFEECYKIIIDLAKDIPNLEFVDFGGGFGVETPEGEVFDYNSYNKMVSDLTEKLSKELGKEITLILEPGRIIGGENAWFVTKVVDVKTRWGHQFVGLNASTVQFPRPLFYPGNVYHPVNILERNGEKILKSSIYGCSTYSRDYFDEDIMLPEIKIGDTVVFSNAGSYCASLYTNFLGFKKLNEYFIE